MRILSFDTSGNEIHLSLLENGRCVKEAIVTEGDAQTRQEAVAALMPAIVDLVASAGWTHNDLNCIVVGEGPGSFTGVRTGVVTARTIAQGLSLPLVPVHLLDCYATVCDLPAAVILAAGRGRYFIAGYASSNLDDGTFEMTLPPVSAQGDELVELLSVSTRWYADDRAYAELSDKASTFAAAPDCSDFEFKLLPHLENIATKQAQIAWNRVSLKESPLETYPYQVVTPFYLRSPSITLKQTPSEKKHGS